MFFTSLSTLTVQKIFICVQRIFWDTNRDQVPKVASLRGGKKRKIWKTEECKRCQILLIARLCKMKRKTMDGLVEFIYWIANTPIQQLVTKVTSISRLTHLLFWITYYKFSIDDLTLTELFEDKSSFLEIRMLENSCNVRLYRDLTVVCLHSKCP